LASRAISSKDQAKDTAHYYSAGYAPPEQYGQSQTSPRSDIYSLGATLHQMLSGQNPSASRSNFRHYNCWTRRSLSRLPTHYADAGMNEQQRPASVAE